MRFYSFFLVFVGANVATAFSLFPRPWPVQLGVERSSLFASQAATDPAKDTRSVTRPLSFEYTHLEINGMLWKIPEANVSIVVDPIASELNFGIPALYRANKKVLDQKKTLDLIVESRPTHCLLSQGWDDHTHLATLEKLCKLLPDLQFIVAPSARDKLASIFENEEVATKISVLPPGKSMRISDHTVLTATEGALVGPPWQARENGWLLDVNQGDLSVYMEPHGDVTDQTLANFNNKKADIVVSPISKQALPAQVPEPAQFTLVYGGSRTLKIAEALKASVIIPLRNGDLDTEGPLAKLVRASGDMDDFELLVSERNAKRKGGAELRVEWSTPGVPLTVRL